MMGGDLIWAPYNETERRADMGEMSVMGQKGDTKIMWNPDNEDETRAAKQTWDELVGKKRFLGFRVQRDGEAGEQVREFDPQAAKLIIAPPMAGGC